MVTSEAITFNYIGIYFILQIIICACVLVMHGNFATVSRQSDMFKIINLHKMFLKISKGDTNKRNITHVHEHNISIRKCSGNYFKNHEIKNR